MQSHVREIGGCFFWGGLAIKIVDAQCRLRPEDHDRLEPSSAGAQASQRLRADLGTHGSCELPSHPADHNGKELTEPVMEMREGSGS